LDQEQTPVKSPTESHQEARATAAFNWHYQNNPAPFCRTVAARRCPSSECTDESHPPMSLDGDEFTCGACGYRERIDLDCVTFDQKFPSDWRDADEIQDAIYKSAPRSWPLSRVLRCAMVALWFVALVVSPVLLWFVR